ncbi:glycosyl hydrolase 5 family protein-like [Salvia hispanica]|uniref:glycosyl hydrolase 5 family protein-like n=1 Tax=Salvia hispanica TaxID=49212 RepID=UPI00200920AC|nr:glycosyl hydrolase 5 family protein-like [Salvia hispanica]
MRGILALLFLQMVALCASTELSTASRWIVHRTSGRRVKLTCVNWPSHVEPMIAEGLEKKPLRHIVKKIAENGFNCVRLTWATFMFTRPEYGSLRVSESLDKYNLSAARAGIARNNPRVVNMTVVELHKAVVDELGRRRVMVVLDNHVSRPTWCCGDDDGNGFFGDADFSPEEWLRGLAAVAEAYRDTHAVVGMSMRNELRGSRQNEADWYKYMQEGANTIHAHNPDVLIIVSGLNYAGNLGFLKSQPLAVNFTKKLVFEAHWYSFGTSAEQWVAQTNQLCGTITKWALDNYLFLTNSFPLFISEFGINQRGDSEADNRYIGCMLAAVAEFDVDWALWTLQGSYILREGHVDLEEFYGVLDFNWDRLRNPAFLDRLQVLRQTNQDYRSKHPTHYIMLHPLSGHCVHIAKNGMVAVASCKRATRWDQHRDDGGPIKLAGSSKCLGVAGDGGAPRVSRHCSSEWKYVSSSGLHLAAQDTRGGHLCLELEKNGSDSKIVTKKCLCVGDDLADLPTCADNPQAQWFKLIPTNI